MEFRPMPKTPRLSREVVITEKIDGTNASVHVAPWLGQEATWVHEGWAVMAGSRTRWLTPDDDNYGWAAWVGENIAQLVKLGPGHHFGEWWGHGINRNYGLPKGDRRFSLFNAGRWLSLHDHDTLRLEQPGCETAPACCHVVPILMRGEFDTRLSDSALYNLREFGSKAVPGFMDAEGIMVYHTAAGRLFKKTIKGDEEGKSFEGHVAKPPKPPRVKDPSKGGRRKEQLPYEGLDRRKT